MNKKHIHQFFLIIALAKAFIAQSTYPIIIGGTIWYKPQTNQIVSIATDGHVCSLLERLIKMGHDPQTLTQKFTPFITIASEQKSQFYSALEKLTKNKSLVLVEDLGSDVDNQSMNTNQNAVNNEFLLGITQECIHRNVPVINIECRQMKTYFYIQLELKQINSTTYPIMDIVENETDTVIQEIKNYKSGLFLHMYNTNELAKYSVLRKKFIENAIQTEFYDLVLVGERDHLLVDLKAINHIALSQNKTDIILAAGGLHTKHVETILPLLGYEKIYQVGYDGDSAVAIFNTIDIKNPICIDIFINLYNKSNTFNITNLLDIAQHIREKTNTLCTNRPKPTYSHFDRMFIEIVRRNARQFPFCLFVPLIIQCLKTNTGFCDIIRL